MRLELEAEEARELFLAIAERISEGAGLGDEDRAALRKWRTESMRPGSEAMRELTAKVNADIERTLRDKQRSPMVKPDWR